MENNGKKYSIKRHLIIWISISVLFASIFMIIFASISAWHEIEEVYDAQLVHSAKLLFQLTKHEILQDDDFNLGIEDINLKSKYEKNIGFRIWYGDKLITQSANSISFDMFSAVPGFSDHYIFGDKWRFFVFVDGSSNIRVEVSERYNIRYELIVKLVSALFFPVMIFIPLIFFIVWAGVHRVLKPVIEISNDVDKRNSDDLSPISNISLPDEIAPLILAINRLFLRIEESFERERKFTEYAAHELRTPLAAMKTQTQVLIRKISENLPDFKDGLRNLEISINRTSHMVNQLFLLVRIQNESFPKEKINLSKSIYDALESGLVQKAELKDIKFNIEVEDFVFVEAHMDSVLILLKNIFDNAIKYSDIGGAIDIKLDSYGVLKVIDTGCGVSDSDKKIIFEKFVRADKSGQVGSGLGLSIVKWIADIHNVRITLCDNNPKGLIVITEWNLL